MRRYHLTFPSLTWRRRRRVSRALTLNVGFPLSVFATTTHGLCIDLCVSAALDAVKESHAVPWLEQSKTDDSTSITTTASAAVSATEGPQPSTSHEGKSAEATKPKGPDHTRVLHKRHFIKALKEITPSSSESLGSLADLRKWNDEFGEGKRGKKKSPWGRGLFGFVDANKPLESVATSQAPASSPSSSPSPSSPSPSS